MKDPTKSIKDQKKSMKDPDFFLKKSMKDPKVEKQGFL